MFTKKEIGLIIIAIIISAFIVALHKDINLAILNFLFAIIIFTIIIFTSTIVKKIASGYFNIKIEYKIWEFSRYGFQESSKLKKPFPIGLFFSFVLSFLTLGYVESFNFLQFDSENIPHKRILRKRGLVRKAEMNESDPAMTAAWGFYSLLLLSIIGLIIANILKSIGIPLDFLFLDLARYSILYGAWNMIPVGNLDGTKLFFGSILNWFLIAILFIIALVPVILSM